MSSFYSFVVYHVPEERDNFYSKIQKPSNTLSIGWGWLNPINRSEQEIKEDIISKFGEGTNNPDNGVKSLTQFTCLKPGDVVFVRGTAKILDIVIITGNAYYDKIGHDQNDYRLKIPFVSLFTAGSEFNTRDIPASIYNEILYDGGVTLVLRKIDEETANILFKNIIKK